MKEEERMRDNFYLKLIQWWWYIYRNYIEIKDREREREK